MIGVLTRILGIISWFVFQGAKFGDVSKIVAQLWEAMSDSEKTEYKKLNEEDKIRHKNQMEAYKAGATFKKGRPSLDDSNTDHEVEKNQFWSSLKNILQNMIRT